MKLPRLAMTVVGAMGLATAMPAHATTTFFDFGANGSGLNTTGTDTYKLTVGGLTVTVKAYGGIYNTVNYASQVDVTWANSGLGASGNGDTQLNNGGGGINFGGFYDGVGEGLLLDFGQVVTLTQLVLGNFDSGDDFDIAVGSPLTAGTALADSFGLQIGNTFTSLTDYTGQQFFIAARDDGFFDGAEAFRLDGVKVNYTAAGTGGSVSAPVPEPATWAMMLVGFGAVGAAMRRRKQPTMRINFA